MKRKALFLTFFMITSLVFAGCSNHQVKDSSTEHKHTVNENGDLREETEGVSSLPSFLDNKSDELKKIYASAANHQELLENIPCYCGCGEAANHKNNYDCFIYENKDNGAVVWDDHATRCGVCLEIAAESMLLYNEGKTIKEIRDYIDHKYREGYAKPTPTPKVS
jgi:Protein of unknown function with PCYCGC motif